MAAIISPKFLDTDGFWKFAVSFDNGKFVAAHTFYFLTQPEVDAAIAKVTPLASSLTDATIIAAKFERIP